MDYKAKYKDALETLKTIKEQNPDNKQLVNFINYKHPELNEVNNTKMLNIAIDYLEAFVPDDNKEDIIAWLKNIVEQIPCDIKKDCENNDNWKPNFEVGDWSVKFD